MKSKDQILLEEAYDTVRKSKSIYETGFGWVSPLGGTLGTESFNHLQAIAFWPPFKDSPDISDASKKLIQKLIQKAFESDLEFKAPKGYSANLDHHIHFYKGSSENAPIRENALFGMLSGRTCVSYQQKLFRKENYQLGS